MKQQNYIRYFRVFKNDTLITEISTNDFRPLKLRASGRHWLIGATGKVLCTIASVNYALSDSPFYGYKTHLEAMKMAKSGALSYINSLIAMGKPGEKTLLQYRMDHYEDLNINLVQANIYKVENKLPNVADEHLL